MARKRVLFISLHFAPEITGNAPYAAGLASGLGSEIDVEVVTTHPHYPEWHFKSERVAWRAEETYGRTRVIRLRHFLPRSPTGISRIVSELSFAIRVLRSGVRRPDIVLIMTPALAPVLAGRLLAKRWRVPVGVIVQDLYSKAFSELGLMNGRLDGLVEACESRLLGGSDGVVAIHDTMKEAMCRDLGVDSELVHVIPNWSHLERTEVDSGEIRSRLGWNDHRFTLVHAGNMGAKQGLEHLLPAARMIDDEDLPLRIVLIGSGGRREELEHAARDLNSLSFLDPVDSREFLATLGAADALLVHERPGLKEMCVPSKLTSYFSAGRPVLAATDSMSAAAHEVRTSGAGLVIDSGSPEMLVQGIRRMTELPLDDMGRRGTEYAREHLNQTAAIEKYTEWVNRLLRR